MMKIYLAFLLIYLFSFSTINAQVTAIPDPAFEQALVNAGIDSNGLNGNILNSDAAPVTYLELDSLGISDLSGIEAFVALEWLIAFENDIVSVDLSSNTQLENVDISFNQIGSVELGQISSITHLNLEGNAITSIDVSNLTVLDDLDIGGNLLTSIDVTNNSILTSLEIWNIFSHVNDNQISSVDLSNNPLLFRFLAIGNQLTSLDISNNPDLFTLNCSDNPIPQLDLSNNLNLFTLSCSNNLLTELDVAHLDLGGLNCYDNQIDFLDLGASSDLVLLNCSNNQLDSIVLPPTPYILDLYLHDNNLTELDVSHLGLIEELICNNNQLQSLNMQNGTNALLSSFNALNNPQLTCIQVDDVNYANTTFVNAVDPGVVFSLDCMTVGVEEEQATEPFYVFPNPASDQLNASINWPIQEIRIYNVLGTQVHSAQGFPVSLRTLTEGQYFIHVTTAEGNYRAMFSKLGSTK